MHCHVNGVSSLFKTTKAPLSWKYWIGAKTSRYQNFRRQNVLAPKTIGAKTSASKRLGVKTYGHEIVSAETS